MTSSDPQDSQAGSDDEHEDQDAGPGSAPTGAAAVDAPEDDQDAGPASVPDEA